MVSPLGRQVNRSRTGALLVSDGRDGTDSVYGVERIRFADKSLAFDVDGNAGQAFRLYQAAFSRRPDEGGLGFQMNDLDQGVTLSQVAANFLASPEFQATYGSLSDAAFVTRLYNNVLYRQPDAGGAAYHAARLESGVARGDILVGFSESPENKAALVGLIENGMVFTWG